MKPNLVQQIAILLKIEGENGSQLNKFCSYDLVCLIVTDQRIEIFEQKPIK